MQLFVKRRFVRSSFYSSVGGALSAPWRGNARTIDHQLLQIPTRKRIPYCRPSTPLFIAFGSNQYMLQQTVLSSVAAGWAPSQIIVVDNTGVSRANARHHFRHTFLNYSLLLDSYGVNIFSNPTRQTFSQLQNLTLELARTAEWTDFYVSHQDVVVRNSLGEDASSTFYDSILREYREIKGSFADNLSKWAFVYYQYDWLIHVNVLSADRIGPWDQFIPYYFSDRNYYGCARRGGFQIFDYHAGSIFDLAECIAEPDKHLFHARGFPEDHETEMMLQKLALDKREAGQNVW